MEMFWKGKIQLARAICSASQPFSTRLAAWMLVNTTPPGYSKLTEIVKRSNDDQSSVVIKLDYLADNQSCHPRMPV